MAAPKRATPAQIINHLRKAEVGLANGTSMKEVCRGIGVTEQTYYRWRKAYGGMQVSQAKRMKELEKENCGFRRRGPPSPLEEAHLFRTKRPTQPERSDAGGMTMP